MTNSTQLTRFDSAEWNFSISAPSSWQVIYLNEPAGSWVIPIGVAGQDVGGGRPGLTVNARRGEILQGSATMPVYAMGPDGREIKMPSTAEEYIAPARASLESGLPELEFASGGAITLANRPAARLVYSYRGQTGRITEESVTYFGVGVTFQFIFEVPSAQYARFRPLFQEILASFRLGRPAEEPIAAPPPTAELTPAQLYNRAVALYGQGQFGEALAAFDECIRTNAFKMQAVYARSLCQQQLGQEIALPPDLGEGGGDVAGTVFAASHVAAQLIARGHQAALTKQGKSSEVRAIVDGARYLVSINAGFGFGGFFKMAWRQVKSAEGVKNIPLTDPSANPNPTAADRLVISLVQEAGSAAPTPLPADGFRTELEEPAAAEPTREVVGVATPAAATGEPETRFVPPPVPNEDTTTTTVPVAVTPVVAAASPAPGASAAEMAAAESAAPAILRLDYIAPPGQATRDGDRLTFQRGRLSSQTVTLDLNELRYAFLFLPSEFKWHFLTPSETQYNYINLDALSEERFAELQGTLAQQNPLFLGRFQFLLADYGGQVFKVSAKTLRDAGIDLLPWLAERRTARQERLSRWVAAGSSITVGAHWFSFRGDINLSGDGVRGGNRFLPWDGLGEMKISTMRSLADVSFFHFAPVKQSGLKGLSTGVSPKQVEAMIAEIAFWRAQNGAQPAGAEVPARSAAVSPKTDPLALVSLISGLLICIPGVSGIVAAITGYLARKRIAASGGRNGGLGFATAGMVLGIIQVAAILLIGGASLGQSLSRSTKTAARRTPTRVVVITSAPKAATARATGTLAPARTPTRPAAAQPTVTSMTGQQVIQTATAVVRMQQATMTAQSRSYEATSQAIKAQSAAQSGISEATAQANRARNTVQAMQQATATAQAAQGAGSLQAAQTKAVAAQATLIARAKWPLKLLDTFDSNVNGWPSGSRRGTFAIESETFAGSKYLIEIEAVQPVVLTAQLPQLSVSDLFLVAEVRRISAAANAYYGVSFRIDGQNQYFAGITADQQFGAFAMVDGQGSVLVPWTAQPAILAGRANRIAVIAEGSRMTFFVNDQLVGEANDSRLKSGTVGIGIGLSLAGDKGSFEYDNFELHVP